MNNRDIPSESLQAMPDLVVLCVVSVQREGQCPEQQGYSLREFTLCMIWLCFVSCGAEGGSMS